MIVYVEYALAENFVIDLALLTASAKLLHRRICLWRSVLASLLGAGFALVYPFLSLPTYVSYVLKTAVGALMCFIVSERVKTKNEGYRYALNAVCFFLLTFAFAGLLSYIPAWLSPPLVALSLAGVVLLAHAFCRSVYKNRVLSRFLYDCTLYYADKRVNATGYLDSGNLAQKNGLPVCFLSPDTLYALIGEAVLSGNAVTEELAVSTVNGDKTYALYKGEIELQGIKKEVYFTASANMVTREYKILLPVGALDGEEENGV